MAFNGKDVWTGLTRRQDNAFLEHLLATGTNNSPHECIATIVVNVLFLTLAWISVILRFATRSIWIKRLGWDDWSMLIAVIFLSVYSVSVIGIAARVTIAGGMEQMTWSNWLISINLLNISEEFYALTISALKISLGLFFWRIATVKWQRIVIYVDVTITCLMGVILFFYAVFQCGVYSNTAEFIMRRLTNKCSSNASALAVTYTHATVSLLTDWTFVLLPIAIVRNSLMNRKEKYTICALLMFASVSGIAAMCRFAFIDGLAKPDLQFFKNAKGLAIWSCIEPAVGIIAGSLVTLRPLLRHVMERSKSISSGVRKKTPSKNRVSRMLQAVPQPLTRGFRAWGMKTKEMSLWDMEANNTFEKLEHKDMLTSASSRTYAASMSIDMHEKMSPLSSWKGSGRDSHEISWFDDRPPTPPPKPDNYVASLPKITTDPLDSIFEGENMNASAPTVPRRALVASDTTPRPIRFSRIFRTTRQSHRTSGLPLHLFSTHMDSMASTDSL